MTYNELRGSQQEFSNDQNPETAESKYEQDISTDFTSEKFINLLQNISEDNRGKAIGMALEYRISNPSKDEFWKYMENLPKSFGFKRHYGDQAIENLGITDTNNLDNKRRIFEEFIKLYNKNGYVFHGFNGTFEEDIRQQGLNTEVRKWDWNELKRITEIGTKAGQKMILGWGTINSEGKIFFDRTAQHTYRYATASPEWFAQFVSEGFHVANEPKKKQAYYRRDYDQAKQNVSDLCDRMMSSKQEDINSRRAYPNITSEERQEVMDFFEKYWQMFTSEKSQPKAALIKRSALPDLAMRSLSFDDYCKGMSKQPEDTDVKQAIDHILEMEHMGVDYRITENIPKNDLIIIDLPDYSAVHPLQ